MTHKTNTGDTLARFQAMDLVASNTPYGVGKDPKDADQREAARDAFLQDKESSWPNLEFPLLSPATLWHTEHTLQRLLSDVDEDSTLDDRAKEVLYEQIALKLAETYRHLEVVRGLGATAANAELSRERAGTMTLEIFGEPKKEIFDALRRIDIKRARDMSESDDPVLATVAREFLALHDLEAVDSSDEEREYSFELRDDTIEKIRGDLMAIFPGLEEFVQDKPAGNLSPEESLGQFEKVLQIVGLDKKGWTVILSEGRAASAESKDSQIQIGRRRKAFTPTEAVSVPIHEAIAHALRAQNTREQEDPIKRQALPGNLDFEEGLGTAFEQIVTGVRRVSGAPYYLSLGYQMRLDQEGIDKKRRDFRDTHEIMWRRNALNTPSTESGVTAEDITGTRESGYQTVIRTTRGNSLDARDISYFSGGQKAKEWLNKIAELGDEERRRELIRVLSARFDPTNTLQDELFDGDIQTN